MRVCLILTGERGICVSLQVGLGQEEVGAQEGVSMLRVGQGAMLIPPAVLSTH